MVNLLNNYLSVQYKELLEKKNSKKEIRELLIKHNCQFVKFTDVIKHLIMCEIHNKNSYSYYYNIDIQNNDVMFMEKRKRS